MEAVMVGAPAYLISKPIFFPSKIKMRSISAPS